MKPIRWSVVLPLAVLFLVPVAIPARAVDVNVTLIAASFAFHVGTASAPASPTITVNVGDVIRFRVENQDGVLHTFNVPHFSRAESLTAGTTIFVNITTTAGDAGTWQFWCDPHSTGSTPETHTGMIGAIQVNAPTPPRTPGFDVVVTFLAAATAFVVLAVYRVRTKP